MEPSQFTDYRPEDFRSVMDDLAEQIGELQKQKLSLMQERRTLETVMYMMFPQEAIRDGYLCPTKAIANRLKRAKEMRESGRVPEADRPSLGAIEAEQIVQGTMTPENKCVMCNAKQYLEGMCKEHYNQTKHRRQREAWKKQREAASPATVRSSEELTDALPETTVREIPIVVVPPPDANGKVDFSSRHEERLVLTTDLALPNSNLNSLQYESKGDTRSTYDKWRSQKSKNQ